MVSFMDTASLAAELQELLNEDIASAVHRERITFDQQTSPLSNRLVLFGAGGLGRKTLAGLRQVGIEPLAFADNNAALWGHVVDGLQVLSPRAAAQEFAIRAVFVVTIWHAGGGHRFAHTRQQLLDMGCPTVVSFAHLFWKYPETFLPYYCLDLPHKICQQRDEVRKAFTLWADEASQREYLAQLRWRLLLDSGDLPPPVPYEQYFPTDLFSLSSDEVFVDCGAFDGDTLKSFLHRVGGSFKCVIAFEPDLTNFQKLESYVSMLDRSLRDKIILNRLAVAAHSGEVYFESTGTAAAAARGGFGILKVDCTSLDELLAKNQPTYIKMDIEGSEMDALAGARQIIKHYSPVLAVCSYHKQNDLWRIPLFIRSLSSQYRFFLRPHNEECWDLVCYAVPVNRLIS